MTSIDDRHTWRRWGDMVPIVGWTSPAPSDHRDAHRVDRSEREIG